MRSLISTIAFPLGLVALATILGQFMQLPFAAGYAIVVLCSFWAGWLVVIEKALSLTHASLAAILHVLVYALIKASLIFFVLISDDSLAMASRSLGTTPYSARLMAFIGFIISSVMVLSIPAIISAVIGGMLARRDKTNSSPKSEAAT